MAALSFLTPRHKRLVLSFNEISNVDVPLVGGKNASLGEMYNKLTKKGVRIPNGFAITAYAYQQFLKDNQLDTKIADVLKDLNTKNIEHLQNKGREIRKLITDATLPENLKKEAIQYYRKLSQSYGVQSVDVAVRSSATAEDLPGASFAGQQATFLNITGEEALLQAIKECFASLFTDRAISYREDKGFDHLKTYLSVGVQKMVRSDKACSGVMFSLDPDTGFSNVVVINGIWGLGELIVQGMVVPDEYEVFKPTFRKGLPAIITKTLGSKTKTLIYGEGTKDTKLIATEVIDQQKYTLTDKEVLILTKWALQIEDHYQKPMDMEWAKDGVSGDLYIVQARPETIHEGKKKLEIESYTVKSAGKVLVKGIAVGTKVGNGQANIIKDASQITKFNKGEVLVTKITDPDWEPIMKIASAIVTDEGGRTSHAAIVSRELGIPCIVGTQNATSILKSNQQITIDCSSGGTGLVYEGKADFELHQFEIKNFPETKTHIMVNIGSPDEAYQASFLPNKGVGLAREEFIIASNIKIHPMALINFNELKDEAVKKLIEEKTLGYKNKTDFYVDKLAQGIAKIGAAFYPNPVIVRFSDFKTNEYASLIGGQLFEPKEENPMIGWRGASRYYDPRFEEAFGLECQAINRVRTEWGISNVIVMVPFCRTTDEAKSVLSTMEKYGLRRGKDRLKVYMMAEIPSDIILAEQFSKLFDGMSIGSNDLTQLTLGIDRDNADLAKIANENNPAVMELIEEVIKTIKRHHKYIGICGQAPSDYPKFAQFLVRLGINSISLNPDTVIKTTLAIAEQEKKLHKS